MQGGSSESKCNKSPESVSHGMRRQAVANQSLLCGIRTCGPCGLCTSLECGIQNEVLSPGVPALQDSVRSLEGCPAIHCV